MNPATNDEQSANQRLPQSHESSSSIRRDSCRWLAVLFFRRTRAVGMNFDVGAVQCKCLNPFDINGVRLEFFFDTVEDSGRNPIAKSPVNGEPVPEFFGQRSPSATVFGHVLQGTKEGKVVHLNIAALRRQQVSDTCVLLRGKDHDER